MTAHDNEAVIEKTSSNSSSSIQVNLLQKHTFHIFVLRNNLHITWIRNPSDYYYYYYWEDNSHISAGQQFVKAAVMNQIYSLTNTSSLNKDFKQIN